MLADKRKVVWGDQEFRTPAIIPSFSSKGFPDVKKIIEVSAEYLSGEVLVSAYDVRTPRYHSKRNDFCGSLVC